MYVRRVRESPVTQLMVCGEAARDRDIRHNKMRAREREGKWIRKELNFWANECECLCMKNLTIYRQVCERVVCIQCHSHSYCVRALVELKALLIMHKINRKKMKKMTKIACKPWLGLVNAHSRFYCEHRKPTHKTYISHRRLHISCVCVCVSARYECG